MVAQPTTPRRAVGYVRVSTEEQNLGPDAQKAQIVQYAERTGLELVAWFEDRLSGATDLKERPELERLLERLTEGDIGFVIVAKRDRIARDVVIAAAVTKAIESGGARLLSADGVSAEDTPEGKLVRLILDAFAEFERLQIGARTRAALRVKKARGERVGAIQYGYRVAPKLRPKDKTEAARLERDPEEQAAIVRVRELAGEGHSLRTMAAILFDEGFSPRRGSHFRTMTLSRIVKNCVDTVAPVRTLPASLGENPCRNV